MIRYSLSCARGHEFDSWFADSAAFATLSETHQLNCPVCGSSEVRKALMAPMVTTADERPQSGAPEPSAALPQPTPLEKAAAQLRARIERDAEYVGMSFVSEARKMHEGTAPERSIYGEARPREARELIRDGIPVAPLPFLPTRKMN